MFKWYLLGIGSNYLSPESDAGGGEISDIDTLDSDDSGDEKEEEDDKEDDKNEEDDEEEVKEEDDEEENKEEEEETNEEEDKELNAAVPDYDEIKKAYPDLFKKFPDLKTAVVRDQKYSEVFSTPEEAGIAAKDSNTLRSIEADLLTKGDPTNLLDVIQKNSAESFSKVSLAILPYLQEKDKDLYYKVASLPIKQLLRSAWREGKGKETDLGRAAAYIHKHFFGNTEVESKLDIEDRKPEDKSKAQTDYEEKLAALDTREFNNFKGSIDTSYVSNMDKLIREGLDKDERINEYMKNKLVEDILLEIRKDLDGDARFSGQLKSLWAAAKNSNYDTESRKKILSTVLTRAKAMVPTKRSKVVSDALKSKKAKASGDKVLDKDKDRFRSTNTNSGDRSSSKSRDKTPNKSMSDLDILRG